MYLPAEVLAMRKQMIELLLSDHPFECLTCERNLNCELQRLAKRYGIRDLRLEGSRNHFPIDDHSIGSAEPDKCIRCGGVSAYASATRASVFIA